MNITFLGTSAAIPTHVITWNIRKRKPYILLDCGDGTTKRLIEEKISIFKIDAVFLSHLHSDHLFGLLPSGTQCLLKREQELLIYGPIGVKEKIKKLITVDERELPFKIIINETNSDNKIDIKDLVITSCKAEHGVPANLYFIFLLKIIP